VEGTRGFEGCRRAEVGEAPEMLQIYLDFSTLCKFHYVAWLHFCFAYDHCPVTASKVPNVRDQSSVQSSGLPSLKPSAGRTWIENCQSEFEHTEVHILETINIAGEGDQTMNVGFKSLSLPTKDYSESAKHCYL